MTDAIFSHCKPATLKRWRLSHDMPIGTCPSCGSDNTEADLYSCETVLTCLRCDHRESDVDGVIDEGRADLMP